MTPLALVSSTVDGPTRPFGVEPWDARILPAPPRPAATGRFALRTLAVLARWVPPAEVQCLAERSAEGQVDIVGGTMAVLAATPDLERAGLGASARGIPR